MMINKTILSLFVLLTATSCADSPAEVTLKGLDDQGKWTIVNVWSTSCPYCRLEMPDLQDFHDAHKDKDATVLGIAIDFPSFGYPNPQTVKDFTLDYFVDFPSLLADADQASAIVGEQVTMIPITFFYSPDGELAGRWEGTITRQDIEKVMSDPHKDTDLFGSGSRGARN